MIIFDNVFYQMATLLLLAAAIGALAVWLRQPLIVGYILVGILAGPSLLGRYGNHIAHNLRQRKLNVLGVDYDREVVTAWQRQGLPVRYGDAEDPEFPATLPLNQAQWVVSAMPQLDVNLALLDALSHHGYSGQKAITAHSSQDAEILKESGADLILTPFAHAAEAAAEILVAATYSKENDST